ncbi:thiol-disulfide oxidoreductase DCC family protein [Balneatrix alpica]|uniref:Thiol-disulfide oxidoreductase DCC family protein n=1 Tax=Balneatrix alpica TaxID=75684 RepID=A0ABV5ZFP1_9GAMM|nr:DUF393 domain-containing protein [Balneatrix alpica]
MYPLEVFYDGACPLCAKEMAWLAQQDRQQRLRLRDIQAVDFDASAEGLESSALDAQLHVRDAKGQVWQGVPAFVLIYRAVGRTSLARVLALPGLAPLWQWGYRHFARHRYRLSAWLGLTDSCGQQCRRD